MITQFHKGYRIETMYDEFAENERKCYEHDTEIVGYHKGYETYDVENPYAGETGSYFGDFKKYINKDKKLRINQVYFLPVFAYVHGTVSLSFAKTCQFDSGQVGYIYARKKDFTTMEDFEKQCKRELDNFSSYINGEVFRAEIAKDDKIIDNICGFYDREELIEYAEEVIDEDIKWKKEQYEKVMAS